MIETSMTICKLVIVYSALSLWLSLTCWCNADRDIQDITTLMTSNEETDSDISATAMDDYNATTAAPTPPMTTINEYYSLSSTLPRDRMGTANSHYHTHKDRPKSEENVILRAPLSSLSSTPSSPITEPSLTHSVGAIAKPTKYHYYPHNQHMYLLPECAVQQVCSAVYVRLNYTQPLCACPSRYREPCSASLNSDDLHTTELSVDSRGKVLTLVKTCEPVKDMRICRLPRDWSLLALQNVRTGKSHYLVICHCPETSILEGPTTHDQPTYASVPGIKVYGMVCVSKSDVLLGELNKRKAKFFKHDRLASLKENEKLASFPYYKIKPLLKYVLD
ncbi:uncharacterized protein dsx-c73A [Planococcus citri]|uniref:uncharacterized protein dsx-c73A n=1 Tax=Planococcus citri TaxID=170843 RepID=UPI0031F8820F